MIIDHQAHWYPRTYFESILNRQAFPRATRSRDGYRFEPAPGEEWNIKSAHLEIEEHLASMEHLGIDLMVSSPNVVGDVVDMELAEARETIGLANQETAAMQARFPSCFVGLAMLPMQDTEAALDELDVAITQLGLAGVCVLSNISGRPLVTEASKPVFKRIEELEIPLFLHPASRSLTYSAGLGRVAEVGLGWMNDTTVAALSLITGGVLDLCPRLEVVHPHLGGVFPYVASRIANIDQMARSSYSPGGPVSSPGSKDPTSLYLRRFHTDSVGATPGALQLAIACYGSDRVLFATDHPWLPERAAALSYVTNNTNYANAKAILHENRIGAIGVDLPVGDEDRA